MIKTFPLNSKGITLVEVIVIAVILGIMAAILIPSFSGYLRKSDESAAIAQCHQVVNAADAVVGAAYKTDRLTTDTFELTEERQDLIGEILKKAEAGGSIFSASLSADQKGNLILVNYETADGIKVVYDEEWEYHGRKALYSVVKNFFGRLDQYVEDTTQFFLDEKNGIVIRDENGKYLQIKDADGIAKYGKEKEPLLKVDPVYTEGIKVEGNGTLYWKPYLMKNGKTFLFASVGNTDQGGWRAYLLYIDGKVYRVNPEKADNHEYWVQIAGVKDHRDKPQDVRDYLKGLGFEEFVY